MMINPNLMLLVILCAGSLLLVNTNAFKEECLVHYKSRINCGYKGIHEKECVSNGCCYDNRIHGVPCCFYRAFDKTCSTEGYRRKACGYRGINQKECVYMGCCYVGSRMRGVPWCFHKGR